MYAFFLVVLLVWSLLHWYFYHRLTRILRLGFGGRRFLRIFIPCIGILYPVGRILAHAGLTVSFLYWPGLVWLGYLSLALCLVILLDLVVNLPAWLIKRSTDSARVRRFLAGIQRWALATGLVLALGIAVFGVTRATQDVPVTEIEVSMPGLPRRMDGFRVVHLTDLHVGELVGTSLLEQIAQKASDLRPDLVVLTGDLVDEPDGGDGSIQARLGQIQSRNGVIAVTGNHEFYSGGETAVQRLQAAGIQVLRQAHRIIGDGLVVAGVDDRSFLGSEDAFLAGIDAALADRPTGLPTLLLTHQPRGVERAADAGVRLMLCGHTHGGQIPPFHLISRIPFPYFSGEYDIGSLHLIVNRGAGFWGPPMRVLADPEIVVVTLRSEAGQAVAPIGTVPRLP